MKWRGLASQQLKDTAVYSRSLYIPFYNIPPKIYGAHLVWLKVGVNQRPLWYPWNKCAGPRYARI